MIPVTSAIEDSHKIREECMLAIQKRKTNFFAIINRATTQ
jgi:hypothetical protein